MPVAPSVSRGTRAPRPRTYAPKGTSWAVAALILLPQAMIMFGLMSAMPWLAGGLDTFIDALIPAMVLSLVLASPIIPTLRTHAWGGVCWFFWYGAILAAAYPVALFVGFIFPLHLVKATFPAARIVGYFGTAGLICLLPLEWLLIRALRLRYWQPWTTPGQWEAGDERAPSWGAASIRARARDDPRGAEPNAGERKQRVKQPPIS